MKWDSVITNEYPIFARYDTLLKKQQHKTGYYREKLDEATQRVAKSLIKDKSLMQYLEKTFPKIAVQVSRHAQHGLKMALLHDQF